MPLTKRKVQTAEASKQRKRQRMRQQQREPHSAVGRSLLTYTLDQIADPSKRRFVAALAARCEAGDGAAATVGELAEHCRADEFGLPKGTGLRATVAHFPKLFAVKKTAAGASPTERRPGREGTARRSDAARL